MCTTTPSCRPRGTSVCLITLLPSTTSESGPGTSRSGLCPHLPSLYLGSHDPHPHPGIRRGRGGNGMWTLRLGPDYNGMEGPPTELQLSCRRQPLAREVGVLLQGETPVQKRKKGFWSRTYTFLPFLVDFSQNIPISTLPGSTSKRTVG